jgi:uncharacterized protein YdaT
MRHLPAPVREKAIEIANALLARGEDDGRAIRIAIAQAKRWEEHHQTERAEDVGGRKPPWSTHKTAPSI